MSAGAWAWLAGVGATFVLTGFLLLKWRRAGARGGRWLAGAAGCMVVLVLGGGFSAYRSGYYDAIRGGAAHAGGDLDGAIRWFERAYAKNPNAFMVAHDMAGCFALKGDEEACFLWLERALESSYGAFAREHAKSDPDFDSVRASQRFQELIATYKAR